MFGGASGYVSVTLVMTSAIEAELREAALAEDESGAVLLARLVRTPTGSLRLLARSLHWVPGDSYLVREPLALRIKSDGFVPALGLAEVDGCVAIWLHTHPGLGSRPTPSEHDDVVDAQLADLFRLRTGAEYYGTLIVSASHAGLTFTGRVESADSRLDIDRIWVVGDWLQSVRHWSSGTAPTDALFDRNVRAFGGGIQRALGDLTVAVVGCGGTGSAVAEQLVRLGVRRFLLIDPDELSLSNVTRVYGSTPSDVGRLKVDVCGDHLCRIASDVLVTRVHSTLVRREVAARLLDADLVFGCTDDNAGRLVLSRLATFLMVPVIDCGVLISSNEQLISGIHGRVTVLTPGSACLICRGRIDLARAAAETMSVEEHQRLESEGYAPELGNVEPAVVTFTTQVAAAAVGELLERLIHYGPEPVPSETILRIHDREQSTNVADPRARHYCDLDQRKVGLGATEPFLEQAWPA